MYFGKFFGRSILIISYHFNSYKIFKNRGLELDNFMNYEVGNFPFQIMPSIKTMQPVAEHSNGEYYIFIDHSCKEAFVKRAIGSKAHCEFLKDW